MIRVTLGIREFINSKQMIDVICNLENKTQVCTLTYQSRKTFPQIANKSDTRKILTTI